MVAFLFAACILAGSTGYAAYPPSTLPSPSHPGGEHRVREASAAPVGHDRVAKQEMIIRAPSASGPTAPTPFADPNEDSDAPPLRHPVHPRPPFQEYFSELLADVLGADFAAALYDPYVLPAYALRPERYQWPVPFVSQGLAVLHPGSLGQLEGFEAQLLLVKRSTSLYYGRLHRDAALRALYADIVMVPGGASDENASSSSSSAGGGHDGGRAERRGTTAMRRQQQRRRGVLLDRSLRHLILGVARYAAMLAQLAVDTNPTAKALLMRVNQQRRGASPLSDDGSSPTAPRPPVDALFAFMRFLPAHGTTSDASRMLNEGAHGEWARSTRVHAPGGRVSPHENSVFVIHYGSKSFHEYGKHSSKFFVTQRPFIACGALQRMCEDPDGCRFLCNPAYVQFAAPQYPYAPPPETASATLTSLRNRVAAQPRGTYLHRFIGMGSFNQYDWEMSALRMFGYVNAAAGDTLGSRRSVAANGLRSLTTLDCTVTFKPPEVLKVAAVGFGTANFCIADRTNVASRQVTYEETLRRVVLSERQGTHETLGIVRYTTGHEVAMERPVPAAFDDVTLLKVDVEAWEYSVLPSLAVHEIAQVRRDKRLLQRFEAEMAAIASSAAFPTERSPQAAETRTYAADLTVVDFTTSAASTIPEPRPLRTVSQIQLEVHAYAKNRTRAVWLVHHANLQLLQLGFAQAAYEYNHESPSRCCFETLWVHYRHFILSEMWPT